MAKLLLIEDDDETAEEVASYLQFPGHEVARELTGPDGLGTARQGSWNLLLVDRLLPGCDGLEVVQCLRREGVRTPVLMVSALGSVDERVRGLRAGGDDYLAKPFVLAELAARVEALLRRPVDTRETLLHVGPLELDLIEGTARRGQRPLDLLPREFKLLKYMMYRVGQTITRDMLFQEVWNYNFTPDTKLVDVHMGRLRRKLDGPEDYPLIRSVRGVGFVLDAHS